MAGFTGDHTRLDSLFQPRKAAKAVLSFEVQLIAQVNEC